MGRLSVMPGQRPSLLVTGQRPSVLGGLTVGPGGQRPSFLGGGSRRVVNTKTNEETEEKENEEADDVGSGDENEAGKTKSKGGETSGGELKSALRKKDVAASSSTGGDSGTGSTNARQVGFSGAAGGSAKRGFDNRRGASIRKASRAIQLFNIAGTAGQKTIQSPFPRRLSEPNAVHKLAELNMKKLGELVIQARKADLEACGLDLDSSTAIQFLQLDEYVSLFSIRDQINCTSRLSYILQKDTKREDANANPHTTEQILKQYFLKKQPLHVRMWTSFVKRFPLAFDSSFITFAAWLNFGIAIFTFLSATTELTWSKEERCQSMLKILRAAAYVMDAVYFTFAILVRLVSSCPEWTQGVEYNNMRTVLAHTIRTKYFLYDLCSCSGLVGFKAAFPQLALVLQLLRCWRLVRLDHPLRLLKYQTIWLLTRVLIYVFLVIHALALIYWGITPEYAHRLHDDVIIGRGGTLTFQNTYLYFLHQAGFLLTGKDRKFKSFEEKALVTLWGPIGGMCMAAIFGQINLVINRRNALASAHLAKMETVKQAMAMMALPADLRRRIFSYHEYLELYQNDSMISALMRSLNAPLQLELRLCIYFSLIVRAQFFHDSTCAAIMRIVMVLEDQYYSPGDYLIRLGEVGHEMFFVIHGQAEALVGDPTLNVVVRYQDGSYFGEVALLTRCPRKAWVRAVTFLVVAVLDKERFDGIAIDHPDAWRSMFFRMKQVLKIASVTTESLKKRLVAKFGSLEEAFKEMDKDGSQELDVEEFSAAMDELMQIDADDSRILFHQIDKNDGGSISMPEFLFFFVNEALKAIRGNLIQRSGSVDEAFAHVKDTEKPIKLDLFVKQMTGMGCDAEDVRLVFNTANIKEKRSLPWSILIGLIDETGETTLDDLIYYIPGESDSDEYENDDPHGRDTVNRGSVNRTSQGGVRFSGLSVARNDGQRKSSAQNFTVPKRISEQDDGRGSRGSSGRMSSLEEFSINRRTSSSRSWNDGRTSSQESSPSNKRTSNLESPSNKRSSNLTVQKVPSSQQMGKLPSNAMEKRNSSSLESKYGGPPKPKASPARRMSLHQTLHSPQQNYNQSSLRSQIAAPGIASLPTFAAPTATLPTSVVSPTAMVAPTPLVSPVENKRGSTGNKRSSLGEAAINRATKNLLREVEAMSKRILSVEGRLDQFKNELDDEREEDEETVKRLFDLIEMVSNKVAPSLKIEELHERNDTVKQEVFLPPSMPPPAAPSNAPPTLSVSGVPEESGDCTILAETEEDDLLQLLAPSENGSDDDGTSPGASPSSAQ